MLTTMSAPKTGLFVLLAEAAPYFDDPGAPPSKPAHAVLRLDLPSLAADDGRKRARRWVAAFETYEQAVGALSDAPQEHRVAFAVVETFEGHRDLPRGLLRLMLTIFERSRGSA